MAPYVYQFRSLCLNVPEYTKWLVRKLAAQDCDARGPPVEFVRTPGVSSLRAVTETFPSTALIVNATGLGSQDIADVQDKSVYPIRGQTVLVNAPRFKDPNVARCINSVGRTDSAYVIPRALSGMVICGGTFDAHTSAPLTPDPKRTERILKECLAFAPELLPEGVDASAPDAWKKIQVVRENIGLRPAREGGARVELDTHPIEMRGRPVGVVHAYGIGTLTHF